MKKGFYTALGTPLDENGCLLEESYRKQIDDQIAAGASGLLIMGSMGMQFALDNQTYVRTAKTGADAVRSRCSTFVGVMDNSATRVLERIEAIGDLDIDGVVATPPFYYKESPDDIIGFFEIIAAKSSYPIYLYDLPVVTQNPMSMLQLRKLMENRNIKGIKTGNINLAREISMSEDKPEDFYVMFSGLDIFDIAYRSGMNHVLDGMLACTPNLTSLLFQAFAEQRYDQASCALNKIITLRNIFIKHSVFPSFTEAMNIHGYEGRFHPAHHKKIEKSGIEEIRTYMQDNELI